MAQLVVRNLDASTMASLKEMASHAGVSLEQQVRTILRAAVREYDNRPSEGLGGRIQSRFADLAFKEELPELKGQHVAPMQFDS